MLDQEVVGLAPALLLAELGRADHLGLLVRVRLVDGGAELLARAVARAAGAVEERVQAIGAVLDGGDDLEIVGVGDGRPRHALVLVLLLLAVEDLARVRVWC